MTHNPYTDGNYLTDESYILDQTHPAPADPAKAERDKIVAWLQNAVELDLVESAAYAAQLIEAGEHLK